MGPEVTATVEVLPTQEVQGPKQNYTAEDRANITERRAKSLLQS